MSPSRLPKQRVVALTDLSNRPEPFESVVGYEEKPPGVRLCNGPKKTTYLGQVEWAWSPMHERIDAYYLHKGRRHLDVVASLVRRQLGRVALDTDRIRAACPSD